MASITTKILTGLHGVANDYEGFLIDVYGVIHDGSHLYPGVIECLEKLSELNKTIAFISNTASRARELSSRLQDMGISRSYYQYIYTAGESTFQHLLHRDDPWYSKLGNSFYFIGSAQSRFIDELPIRKVDQMEEADFILVTSADDWHQRLSDYKKILSVALKKGIPMICANPNISEATSQLEAGSIEKYYEEQGGEVRVHGKPNKLFFQHAVDQMACEPILAIGDSLFFDMKGAASVGLDTAFVACCTHKLRLCDGEKCVPKPKSLADYYDGFGFTPKYTLPQLVW